MTAPKLSLLVAVILCGLSAGSFYTYEASVTLGLADVDDSTYVTAFQALNDNVRNPAFGIMFFGSLPAIGAALAFNWNDAHPRRWLIAGDIEWRPERLSSPIYFRPPAVTQEPPDKAAFFQTDDQAVNA